VARRHPAADGANRNAAEAALALFAPGSDRELISTADFAVDVRGSVTSTRRLTPVRLSHLIHPSCT